ncbi:MAG TPA: 30S ribosomal protein S8 [Longimicrobiaceae bacterium]|nr:30S ribosomal protein S8 [Longimicrobiaceae bacterium]
MVTDPIADMLTRLRNAAQARHRRVDMPISKLKTEIARLLKENHYIHDYKILQDEKHGVLRLYLKYHQEKPIIRELKRVSKPGLRSYVRVADIPRVRNGLGMAIISTSRGVMTDKEARSAKVGGEVLALIW